MKITKQQLETAFNAFNNFNIIIIGDVMLDSYIWGDVTRISPEAPIPIVNAKMRENRLGGAANVALNIQALGANPILCSVIGNDERSSIFFELLKDKHGMITDGIITENDRITTTKFRIISAGQHLLRVDEESDHSITSNSEQVLLQHIKGLSQSYTIHAIIFQDYDKGVLTPWLINEVVQFAQSKNIPTLVDPKKRNFLNYNNVTLFKPNFKELCEGINVSVKKHDINGLVAATNLLKTKLNAQSIFVTLSEHGVLLNYHNGYEHIKAELREIVDVSGAGDTVISTISVCLAAGIPLEISAYIANLAGGLVCENVGVVPVVKQQLFNEAVSKLSA